MWGHTAAAQSAEPFLIEPGTVLEVSVVGIPGFRYEFSVEPSGEVAIPLLEPLQASGLTIGDLRTKVRELLATKILRQHLPDGREVFLTADAEQVHLDVVEYPPVYVDGDVARAGAIGYIPGMTVRQALALAGGYDLLSNRTTNPFLEAADLRGEYRATWMEYVRQQVLLAGLQALLDGRNLDEVTHPRRSIGCSGRKNFPDRGHPSGGLGRGLQEGGR